MILPYKLGTTNDKITSRAGLLTIAELMSRLQLAERIDQHFPQPKSNRGFKPSVFAQTLLLMLHEGGFHLDDVRHLRNDKALRLILDLKTIPQACSLGAWLRRMGENKDVFVALNEVNKVILKSALHHRKGITLDIDATEITASKAEAEWTYNKNQGYMPMVGHIAETGQVVTTDFREGNTAPAAENLEFIKTCQKALPEPCFIQSLRIDAAGYQTKIIQFCDQENIRYAIRAKMSPTLKAQINALKKSDWQPLLSRDGKGITDQETYRTSHCIGDYEQPFMLIIQRTRKKGQTELDLDSNKTSEAIVSGDYIYRAIATNQNDWTDSQIIHWYNQRGEDSENRIKELKSDFGGNILPCSDFNANALYFSFCALAYNLFALMRQLLPEDLAHHRAKTIRWRLYGMAAKIVKTGRQLFVKLQATHQPLLEKVLNALRSLEPPPIS